MNLTRTSRRAQLGVVFLLIGAALLWLETLRFAPVPFLLVACVLYNSEKPDMRPTLLCVLAFVLLTFSPIDVLPIHTRFPPKIVP